MLTRNLAILALVAAPLAACAADATTGDPAYDTEICPLCSDAHYTFTVTTEAGLGASIRLVYQAEKDTFSCTDLTWDMLSPKRVPEQYEVEHEPDSCLDSADGSRTCYFAFPEAVDDGCDSIIRHIYLAPSDEDGEAEAWAWLEFTEADELPEVQQVACSDSDGLINCGNDLLHHDRSLRGRAHLSWAE